MKRFLCTTAMESTWKVDEPILFLGGWCKLFNRKEGWSKLNFETVPYCWDNKIQFHQDVNYLLSFYEKFLKELVQDLNRLHNSSYDIRFWRILIGPWLNNFIPILYERWKTLSLALFQYGISNTWIFNVKDEEYTPADTGHFDELSITDAWNHWLYGFLIRKNTRLNYEFINGKGQEIKEPQKNHSIKYLLKKKINYLARHQKNVIVAGYFPNKALYKAHLLMKQLPVEVTFDNAPCAKVNKGMRSLLSCSFVPTNEYERLLCYLVPTQIPSLYIEGFQELMSLSEKGNYPQQPQRIYTANAFWRNEGFKAWAALQTQKGTKIIIGQHGGNYGTGRFNFAEKHEVAISDLWISWGWDSDKDSKINPGYAQKLINKKLSYCKKEGDILLICDNIPRYMYRLYSVPMASQQEAYFDALISMLASLHAGYRNRVTVRLALQDYGWNQESRWRKAFPYIMLDTGKRPYYTALSKCSLAISTSNQTTFLETMAMGVPTLLYMDTHVWEIRPSAQYYFDVLKEIGVLHESALSCAQKIEQIADNIEEWWLSKEVRLGVKQFIERFARVDSSALKVWTELLTSA